MKILNIIKIDSFRKTVEAVTMENNLQGIYKALEVDFYAHAMKLHNGDILLADGEALVRNLTAPPTGFLLDGLQGAQILFGQGVILRSTPGGSYRDAKSTVEYIQMRVKFPEQKDLNAHFLHYSGRPASDIPAAV